MDHHPSAEELQGFVNWTLSTERTRAVILHLLGGCGTCQTILEPDLRGWFGVGRLREAPRPYPVETYDAPFDRAFAKVKALNLERPPFRTAEQKKQEALALLVSGGLKGLGKAPAELRGIPIFEALLERSWALRHDDPDQMLELARCAALLADQMDDSGLGETEIADLRCRAWTEVANAYRVADALDKADDAIERAMTYLLLGSRDDSLGARFFDIQASQYAARRFFDMACATLDLVIEIYRRHGEMHLSGRALIMKGIFTGYRGNAEEAVRLIRRGLSSANSKRDPALVFSAVQSQAWFLVDCGRYREARFALWDLNRRKLDYGGRINDLKVRWLEGHIFFGLRELNQAEQALSQVKNGFEEAGLQYKAALVGLELGAVRLQQGRVNEAAQVVMEATEVFLSLKIQRELLASVLLLQKASEVNARLLPIET